MSITSTGTGRHRQSLLRQLAHQAAAHPKIEAAVMGAIRAVLPDIMEGLLRDSFPGETVHLYGSRRSGFAQKDERDLRIIGMAEAPSSLSPADIASREGLTVRRVQQILKRGLARNSPV